MYVILEQLEDERFCRYSSSAGAPASAACAAAVRTSGECESAPPRTRTSTRSGSPASRCPSNRL